MENYELKIFASFMITSLTYHSPVKQPDRIWANDATESTNNKGSSNKQKAKQNSAHMLWDILYFVMRA